MNRILCSWSNNSIPSIPGICTSSKIIEYLRFLISCRASNPLFTAFVSYPRSVKEFDNTFRYPSSSSTISTLFVIIFYNPYPFEKSLISEDIVCNHCTHKNKKTPGLLQASLFKQLIKDKNYSENYFTNLTANNSFHV